MLVLLSPAKSLDFESKSPTIQSSTPVFIPQTKALISVLKQKKPAEISELMDISEKLAELNVQRYKAWSPEFTEKNSKIAILAFNGDVYEGLDAPTLSLQQLEWANQHICILSGLYGVLRPLDLMQAYRLEMGTALTTKKGSNLYQFWDEQISDYLNQQLVNQTNPVIINLASQEYFKSVKTAKLKAKVIECVFQDEKNQQYKIISFFAKRARGLMARYIVENKLTQAESIQSFNLEGYRFCEEVSNDKKWVFRRSENYQKQ